MSGAGARGLVTAIGIDLGGTKCAGGVVAFPAGTTVARHVQPTNPARGGAAILDDVTALVERLCAEAAEQGYEPELIGLGVAELIGVDGRVVSAATIPWEGVDVVEQISERSGLPVVLEADVRAAARAEARLGAGCTYRDFLFVTIGTGVSACLVLGGVPYAGARGFAGTFASAESLVPAGDGTVISQPLEQFAAGPAMARRMQRVRSEFAGTAAEVVALAEQGDRDALAIVTSSGEALGAAIAQLVNMLDPAAVVLGGGLGMATGLFRDSLASAVRRYVWSPLQREMPVVSAALGTDAGFIGAALAAVELSKRE